MGYGLQRGCFRPLGILGVGDCPAEALKELRGGMVVAEMYRVDPLVQQHRRGVLGRWIGRHGDPGHEISLVDLGGCSILLGPLEGAVKPA